MTRDPNAATRAELRRQLKKATPAPWKFDGRAPHNDLVLMGPDNQLLKKRDAMLMATMRNALPALLDEIDAARRFITKHEEHYGPICWRCQVLEERGYCGCAIAANE